MTVTVCPGLVGRDLLNGLRRAGDGGRALLMDAGWPVPMTNAIAYGLASGSWGGRDVASAAEWSLLVSNFPWCDQEAFDDFRPPADLKREPRPRLPTTMAQWGTCADNAIKAFGFVYGQEYVDERLEVRRRLEHAHEENRHACPREQVWDEWEELSARWWEELAQPYRSIVAELGTDGAECGRYGSLPMPHDVPLGRARRVLLDVIVPRRERHLTRAM